MTVAELLVTGMPAILVPLPGAPRDHQTRNAEALVAVGAAILVPDAECTAERLERELLGLLSAPGRLEAMGAAARATKREPRRARARTAQSPGTGSPRGCAGIQTPPAPFLASPRLHPVRRGIRRGTHRTAGARPFVENGAPGGESVAQVSVRADQAIALALEHMDSRDVIFVGHSHFSRAVITRWIELPLPEGVRFAMPAASIAVCGFEHGLRQLRALGLTGYPHPSLVT